MRELRPISSSRGCFAATGVLFVGCVLVSTTWAQQQPDVTMTVEARGRDQKASRITLDFVNAEIQQLLRFLSHETNLTIIASAEDVQNKRLSLVNLRNVTIEEALERIKSGLMQFGLTTIQTDTTLIITTVQKAAKMKVPVSFGADPAQIPDTDAVITHIIPLANLDASQIAERLKPMTSDAGVVFGDATSNSVVVTDIASNIRRIAQTLKVMDASDEGIGLKVKVIQIRNGSAETIARALNDLFREEAQASALVRKATSSSDPALTQKLLDQARSSGVDLVRGRVQISANAESNQVIVKASESNIAIIETLVSQMDVAPAVQTEFRVYRLRYASAKTVADYLQNVLTGRTGTAGRGQQQQQRFRPPWEQPPPQEGTRVQGLVGEVRIAADERLNGIVVATDPRNFTLLDRLIEQIDQQDQPAEEIQIFFLQHGNAQSVVETIQTLIQGQQQQRGNVPWWWDDWRRQQEEPREGVYGLRGQVQLSADTRLNAVVAATSAANLAVLKDLIQRLDVSMPSQEWGTRIYQLQYADATNVANIINSVYQGASRQQGFGGGFFFFLQQAGRQRNQAQGSLAGNVVAQEYPTTNSVIISTATARNFELIEQFIKQLDVPTPPQQREVTRIFNLEYANAEDLASLLSDLWADQETTGGGGFFNFVRQMQRASAEQTDVNSLAGKVRLFADPQTNSLVVTTAARYVHDVEEIVRQLDIVRGQVWLDITILEATLDDSTKLGMELSLTEKRLFGVDAFGKGRAPGKNPLTGTFTSDVNLDQEVTGFTLSLATKEYLAFLHTLMRENKVKTLSRPSVQVRDNQQVVFRSGRDIPYLQSARTSDFLTGQIFDFNFLQDIGINITITPHIARRVASASGKRTIGLEIQQIGVSNLIEFTSFNAPLTEDSSIQTYVDAEDGQQVVIGGLKKQKKQKVTDKVPILGDLPLVGRLFKRTEEVTQDTEIVVIISPHIVDINRPEDRARLEELQQERFGSQERGTQKKEPPLQPPSEGAPQPLPLPAP